MTIGPSVTPDQLIAFAWSAPMRELASRLGMSDVGLKKLLRGHGVPLPRQGHWNRVHAGRNAEEPPAAPARGPGHSDRIRLDGRFAGVLDDMPSVDANGPFASPRVPEELDELRTQELKAIGRVAVPRNLALHHPGLAQLLAQEERRRAKSSASAWDRPLFDTPVGQRRLRLLNALFMAISRRGHTGDAYERDGDLLAGVVIGNTHLSVVIEVTGRHRTTLIRGYHRPAPDLPASTPLRLAIYGSHGRQAVVEWRDDEGSNLESQMTEIAAGVIVAGEAAFRSRLREAVEQAERQRLRQEQEHRQRLAELERLRVEALRRSGELLREAQALRHLVVEVKAALLREGTTSAEQIAEWEAWALSQADLLDPIRSGQVREHLTSPEDP